MSSSEDEDQSSDALPDAEQTENRNMRFQCPADFVSFNYKPCSSSLNSSKELWLIRAPANFNPQSFRGVQLPLRGLQTVTVPSGEGSEQSYNILGSSSGHPELRLLAPPSTLAPPFSGLISICETHSDHSPDQLHVVPAAPPPALPPGLQQRFQHFQTGPDPSRRAHRDARKRKKEKKIKSEPPESDRPEEVEIKTEIKDEPLDTGFGEQLEVRKKKKKKSKRAE